MNLVGEHKQLTTIQIASITLEYLCTCPNKKSARATAISASPTLTFDRLCDWLFLSGLPSDIE